jgi:hypothetical protein
MCPYKDTLGPLQESLAKGTGDSEESKAGAASTSAGAPDRAPAGGAVSSAGKYVPPSKRDGAKTGDAMPDRRRSESNSCFISSVFFPNQYKITLVLLLRGQS